MKLNENSKSFHLGNAIVCFEEALSISKTELKEFIDDVEENAILQGFDEKEKRNEGGYEFTEEKFSEAPHRFVSLDSTLKTESGKNSLNQIQKAIYQCVVKYCRIFPVALSEVKWSTDGYIIKYSNNQNIGPHSDCALPYGADGITPISSYPLHNTLTVGVVLNDDFDGGEIIYRPWGITSKPPAGSILIYPSCFTGCHEVSPVTSGTRYAYLCWYGHGVPDHMGALSVPSLVEDVGDQFMEQEFVDIGEIKNL